MADAVTVIGDFDAGEASVFDVDLNLGGACIKGIFEQFFDDAGRALDHFSGGDLVGESVGEDVDGFWGGHGGNLAEKYELWDKF